MTREEFEALPVGAQIRYDGNVWYTTKKSSASAWILAEKRGKTLNKCGELRYLHVTSVEHNGSKFELLTKVAAKTKKPTKKARATVSSVKAKSTTKTTKKRKRVTARKSTAKK